MIKQSGITESLCLFKKVCEHECELIYQNKMLTSNRDAKIICLV